MKEKPTIRFNINTPSQPVFVVNNNPIRGSLNTPIHPSNDDNEFDFMHLIPDISASWYTTPPSPTL